MDFNNMIGKCNISWVEEFYANAFRRADDDYTSYVCGVEISRDWHYTSRGVRLRLQITDMMPVAKGWAK
ncbi:hypothetical protein A2U01_0055767, partial [Trifolium medium]|nr:hypothetical protein [Trifolium medium]